MSSTMTQNYFCCVDGCFNRLTDPELSFFSLPSAPDQRTTWLQAIGREDLIGVNGPDNYICSQHFDNTSINVMVTCKLLHHVIPMNCLQTNDYMNPLRYQQDEDISDVGTQTDVSFANAETGKNVFLGVGYTDMTKKEDPHSTFMFDRPIKRKPDANEQVPEMKRKK